MSNSTSLLHQLDSQLDSLFASWNSYTTILFLVLTLYFLYPLLVFTEPDTHPLLLARQANASPIRQPGESAVYRSQEIPHGYPLRTGLNVKDENAPKWSQGRDGDLRDVWKQAIRGPPDANGQPTGGLGKVYAVMGKDTASFELHQLSKEIAKTGEYLRQHNANRVAILLPDSAELLVAFFAAIFFNVTPIFIPHRTTPESVCVLARESKADTVIASAGTIPLDMVNNQIPSLKQVIWVAEPSSRHMDWHEVPAGAGGKIEIAVWHEILEELSSADLPHENIEEASVAKVVFANIGSKEQTTGVSNMMEMEQRNIVAAIAAQRSALPASQRQAATDNFFSFCPLTSQYPLVMLLTALHSNSSIMLSASSSATTAFNAMYRTSVCPTVVLASPHSLLAHLKEEAMKPQSYLRRFRNWQTTRTLASGKFPMEAALLPAPRLIYTFQSHAPPCSFNAKQLSNLRILTKARIIQAYIHRNVAGAIAQTHVFDYRVADIDTTSDGVTHFGPPTSCLEVKLLEPEKGRWEERNQRQAGQLVVEGPAVVGGRVVLEDVSMVMTDSNTLAYAI